MNYDTGEYANSRLSGTIVRLGEEPFYVNEVTANKKVYGYKLSDADIIRVNLVDLNLEPVPLGFLYHLGRIRYLARVPKRNDWRQGLRPSNCAFLFPPNIRVAEFDNVGLRECILGTNTKPIQDCILAGSGIIHRHWAIVERKLIHKSYYVADVVDGMFVFKSNYAYLASRFSEDTNVDTQKITQEAS